MSDSLKTLLLDQLSDLQECVVAHLDSHPPADVLGEDLDQLRSSGTGKSLVLLALFDDLLRMTEIVLAGRWNPLDQGFAEFASPFFQSAAKTFTKKGLKQYAEFTELSSESARKFLEFHASSGRPFGGHHQPTQWSGLKVCANVSSRFGNLAAIDGYERLAQTLLNQLAKRVPKAKPEDVRQLTDFITDRCGDARDQWKAQHPARQADQQPVSKERAELAALRTELESKQAHLAEWEALIQQEWKRFQQERAEFEQLRQQWEERLADQPDHSAAIERLANERETLAIERAALNNQRQELEAAQAEWERSGNNPSAQSNGREKLEEEQARLRADRRRLEKDRAALWHEREELAALREQLLAEKPPVREGSHILFDVDSAISAVGEKAAVMTVEDANDVLMASAVAGDLAQLQAALAWGADVNHSSGDQGWRTPLHLAARAGHVELIEILLSAGSDAERTDAESRNPLESAIINEQPEAARLLADRAPGTIVQAYPLLVRILKDVKSPVVSRQLCLEAVGMLESRASDSIPTLLNLLESETRELGLAAAEALAKIDPAAVVAQAIPYLSYILNGPLLKQDATNPEWIANLYAARGDLFRLKAQYAQAASDYEAALNYAAADLRPMLQEFLDQMESRVSKSPVPDHDPQPISSPREGIA
jgi:hypothetical protein